MKGPIMTPASPWFSYEGLSRKVVGALLVLAVGSTVGCGSASKKADGDGAGTGGAPAIENTPMNMYDVQGSDSGKIEGLETINFEYDKSNLTTDGRRKAQMAAEWMKKNSNVNLQIEGHCDARGSIEYNLSLGERRANTVLNYMKTLGVESSRMSVISYGKEKLLSPGDSESDHARNRRANFVPLAR